jgi:hypothetical protein
MLSPRLINGVMGPLNNLTTLPLNLRDPLTELVDVIRRLTFRAITQISHRRMRRRLPIGLARGSGWGLPARVDVHVASHRLVDRFTLDVHLITQAGLR